MEANPINVLIALVIIFAAGILGSKGFKRGEGSGRGSSKKSSTSSETTEK